MKQEFNIRDMREKGYFQIDDLFIDRYARMVGATAALIYTWLCRYANKEQKCWPSIQTLSDNLEVNEKTIRRSLKVLEKHNLISVERKGKTMTNRYWLINKSEWTLDKVSDRTLEIPKKDPNVQSLGSEMSTHSKDTHSKDTQLRIASGSSEPSRMGLEEFKNWCKQSKHRHIHLIADYADAKQPPYETKEQWNAFIKRNLRPARLLAPFSDKQIEDAAKELYGQDWLSRWTLETLAKFVIK